MSATTDADLVERVNQRDTRSFEQLFRRYEEGIRRHLQQIVRDEAAADDLLQEVFLRLWDSAAQWSGQGSFRAWFFRVATNAALTHLRTVRRRREQRFDFSLDSADAEGDSGVRERMIEAAGLGPDALYEQADQQRWLWQQVGSLSAEKREVFRLIYEAHVEVREAAERLGVPEGTIKSRLHHSRREIARAWQNIEKEEEDH